MAACSRGAALSNEAWESSPELPSAAVLNDRPSTPPPDSRPCGVPALYYAERVLLVTAPLKQDAPGSAATGCFVCTFIRSKESMCFPVALNCNDTNKVGKRGKSGINTFGSNAFIRFRSLPALRVSWRRSKVKEPPPQKKVGRREAKLNLKLCAFIIKHLEVEGQSPWVHSSQLNNRPSVIFHQPSKGCHIG